MLLNDKKEKYSDLPGSLSNKTEAKSNDENYDRVSLTQGPFYGIQIKYSPSTIVGDDEESIAYIGSNSIINTGAIASIDKKKIGHREVKDGVVHYKSVPLDELKKSIQFGISYSTSVSNKCIDRDLILDDFNQVDIINFPRTGSSSTPPHHFKSFKLKVYAPFGFKCIRRKIDLDEGDFINALCQTELKDISNPGASGSVFYKTSNDKYIIKTVQHNEFEIFKTLLPGYTSNLLENLIHKNSMLPIFYGLYSFEYGERMNIFRKPKPSFIRIVIMKNIFPSDISIHEKYDLKGSSYKRQANANERAKSHPTYKDLDFLQKHPNGIFLDELYYDILISNIKQDCLILQSFGIMDYSLLLGIHNLDKEQNRFAIEEYSNLKLIEPLTKNEKNTSNKNKINDKLDGAYKISTIPAQSSNGDRLLVYLGIIDILQNYRLKKKFEHTLKSMITDGNKISVVPPSFYKTRFIEFIANKVFKKATIISTNSTNAVLS